jgi:HK97 family phage prohead protease
MENQTLKEYSKEAAKKLAKAFAKINLKEVKGEGEFEVVATTEGVDRDGEVILVKGWDFKNFMKNPVVLFGHDYWSFPIGAVTDLRVEEGKVIAKGVFARTDEGQKARTLYEDGILKTVSVGFIVKNRESNIITEAELLELSFVPVPSNPEALDTQKRIKDFENMLTTRIKVEKSVVPFDETEKAGDIEWDAKDAAAKVKEWATDDEGSLDLKKQAKAYTVVNDDEMKLLHHTVVGDKLAVVWKGVMAAMASLLSEDSDIPEDEKEATYKHLKQHYEQFEKEAPEFKSYTQYELDNLFPSEKEEIPEDAKGAIDYIISTLKSDVNCLVTDAVEKIGTVMGEVKDVEPSQKAGRVLSSKTRTTITNAVDAMGKAVKELKELLEASDTPKDDEEKEAHLHALKVLQSIDKMVESGIVKLKKSR